MPLKREARILALLFPSVIFPLPAARVSFTQQARLNLTAGPESGDKSPFHKRTLYEEGCFVGLGSCTNISSLIVERKGMFRRKPCLISDPGSAGHSQCDLEHVSPFPESQYYHL